MPPKDAVPTCRQAGVIGTIQDTEALKYILEIGNLLTGYLLTYDALTMNFRKVKISKNKNCAVCSENPSITEITELVNYEQPLCSFRK